jgi:hypothetical protein
MPDVFPNVWPHSIGPILAYMAACPGDSCEGFDGSGDVWFKIGQVGLSPEAEDLRGPWQQGGLLQPGAAGTPGYTVAIPKNLKSGKYLIRHEVIMLASRPPQFYIECAQLSITGNGTASPSGDYLASFPGAYKDEGRLSRFRMCLVKWTNRKTDPGLAMSQWWVCIAFKASRLCPEVRCCAQKVVLVMRTKLTSNLQMGPNGSPFQPEWNTAVSLRNFRDIVALLTRIGIPIPGTSSMVWTVIMSSSLPIYFSLLLVVWSKREVGSVYKKGKRSLLETAGLLVCLFACLIPW